MPLANESSSFIEKLVALRDYYQSRISKSETNASYARVQLDHINALLVEQFLPVAEQTRLQLENFATAESLLIESEAAAPIEEPSSITSEVFVLEKNTLPTPKIKAAPAPAEIPDTASNKKPADVSTARKTTATKSTNTRPTATQKPSATAPAIPAAAKKVPTLPCRDRSGRTMILALQPTFQGLSKIDAVAKVMQNNVGTVIKTDEIIRALYGELTETELKAERLRTRDVLKRGVKGKRWAKLRDQSYTHDLAALKPTASRTSKSKAAQETSSNPQPSTPPKKHKAPVSSKEMERTTERSTLPQASQSPKPSQHKSGGNYENLDFRPQYLSDSLIDSVENVLQAHRGQPMTSSSIAAVLFEEIDPTQLSKIRKQLNGVLFRGLKQKRWQRVRGQNGAYVLA
jgi:hypothetical protein